MQKNQRLKFTTDSYQQDGTGGSTPHGVICMLGLSLRGTRKIANRPAQRKHTALT